MPHQGIVITGEGIVCAIGNDVHAVSESLKAKRSGIGEMRYLGSRHHELPVGEVKMTNEEMKSILGIAADKQVSRTTLMGIIAVKQALQQAHVEDKDSLRILLVSGTTVGGMDITENMFGKVDSPDIPADWLCHHDCGSSTADITGYFGVFKDYATISTACSSAANAFILAADMLKAGDADIVVAGGTEALSKFHLNGFNSLMILDKEQCRPFDKTRAGLNLGEGAAYVVLERESDARQRGAKIEAHLTGYGNACDAFHQTASSPEDTGAQLAMRKALRMAGLKPGDVQWVHAHGTGTPDNDKSESVAIREVYGDHLPFVSSTKGFTGHTTSASGAISVIISIIAMHEGFVPENYGFHEAIEGGIVPVEDNTPAKLHHIMVNSFGFGGNDSSLILSDSDIDNPSDTEFADVDIIEASRVENDDVEMLKDIKQYVKPMEARRMGKLMKNALLTSLKALEEAGVDMPDAIVTGTAEGSLEYSERLLEQLVAGDDKVKPTYFMQSTHNTVSSLIAIHLKCHGYNITFTQGGKSLEWAVYQAKLLLRSGRYKTVLIGCHDESTPQYNTFMERIGKKETPMVYSVAMVLKLKEQ